MESVTGLPARDDSHRTPTCEVYFENMVDPTRTGVYIVQIGTKLQEDDISFPNFNEFTLQTATEYLKCQCNFDPNRHCLSFLIKDYEGCTHRVYIWCEEQWKSSLKFYGSKMKYLIGKMPEVDVSKKRKPDRHLTEERPKTRPCRRSHGKTAALLKKAILHGESDMSTHNDEYDTAGLEDALRQMSEREELHETLLRGADLGPTHYKESSHIRLPIQPRIPGPSGHSPNQPLNYPSIHNPCSLGNGRTHTERHDYSDGSDDASNKFDVAQCFVSEGPSVDTTKEEPVLANTTAAPPAIYGTGAGPDHAIQAKRPCRPRSDPNGDTTAGALLEVSRRLTSSIADGASSEVKENGENMCIVIKEQGGSTRTSKPPSTAHHQSELGATCGPGELHLDPSTIKLQNSRPPEPAVKTASTRRYSDNELEYQELLARFTAPGEQGPANVQ